MRADCPAIVLTLAALTAACHSSSIPASPPSHLTSPPARPQLMFVSLASDDTFHRVELAPFGDPAAGAFVTDLSCLRAYFGQNRGICLTADTAGPTTTWWAEVFDDRFHRTQRMPLTGEPSRVRVSPDGQLAAATVFESGHSYSEHGFSTRTTIFDLASGTPLGDLEAFQARRDGKDFRAVDFNYWGVTFARDSDSFFATLDTDGVSYLVKGTARGRSVEVVKTDVECPSLSPDNTRIAFKRRVGARSRGWWQLAVLDLATLTETVLTNETRSVDDQVEWLDDERVVYHLSSSSTAADLWAMRVDNTRSPERILTGAYSPAVIR